MKSWYSLLMLLLLCACKPDKVTYGPVQRGTCATDTSHHYHFSLPEGKNEKLPLLIVLDPHGNGKQAVDKFRAATQNISCMIAGSDKIRNNMPGFEKAISQLIRDVSDKFPVDTNRIILAGFSGGARMAFEYARNNKTGGLLMCGAGPSNMWNFSCPVYLIAGTTDFNFREAWINPLGSPFNPAFYTDYFRGKHDWPPVDLLNGGISFLLSKTGEFKRSWMRQQSGKQIDKADSLMKAGDYLLAVKSAEKALLFDGKNKQAIDLLENVRKNRACITHMNEIEDNLTVELKIVNEYIKALPEKDSTWWFHELDYLMQQTDLAAGNKKDHFMRIKSFLGIVFFSQINKELKKQPVNPQVIHLLAAYKKAEPENPDVYYDFALFSLAKGETEKSREYLKKAQSYGFIDPVRIRADFPEGF